MILIVKQPVSSRRNKPCHLQHPVDVFCAKPICVGNVQFMGGVNRVGHVAFSARASRCRASVCRGGRATARAIAETALYIERVRRCPLRETDLV